MAKVSPEQVDPTATRKSVDRESLLGRLFLRGNKSTERHAADGFLGRGGWGLKFKKRQEARKEAYAKIQGMTVQEMGYELRRDAKELKGAMSHLKDTANEMHETEHRLDDAVNDAEEVAGIVERFIRDAEGDIRLMEHKKNWVAAVEGFTRDAFGLPAQAATS